MNPSTIDLLCMLGDKAVYVVMLMAAIGQPIEQQRLEAITRYSWQTLNKTMAKLAEHRIVARYGARGPWMLTTYGQQLRLGEIFVAAAGAGPSKFEGDPQNEGQYPQEGESYPQVASIIEQRSSKFEGDPQNEGPGPSNFEGQDHLASSSSSRYQTDPENPDPLLLLDDGETSPGEVLDSHNESALYDVRAALAGYGVNEPALSELAVLPHITALYVDAHCSRVLADGKEIALAIYRMRNRWVPGKLDERYLSDDGRVRSARRFIQ